MTSTLRQLALGRSDVDRAAHLRTDSQWWNTNQSRSKVIEVHAGELGVHNNQLTFRAPHADEELAFLGISGDEVFAVALGEFTGDTSELVGLRVCGNLLNDRDAGLAVTAAALHQWHLTHTHCPRCGTPTFVTTAGWVRQCPADGTEHYPRTDPAVICAIVDVNDRLLLARQVVWQENHFSIIAGFVEPGETFEAAVKREAVEEVGIEVDEVEYLGSQPWPFPASNMIGFQARALSTDITVDGEEIAQAAWFSREELVAACKEGVVRLPSPVSIARRIIERWYGDELPSEWSR